MWDLLACRSCLAINVKLEKVSDSLRRIYKILTGLEFKTADGYPNYLCIECHAQIKKALAFRRKSRRAFFVMKEIKIIKKQITLPDLMTVDKVKTNLKSTLGFWPIECNKLYAIDGEYEPGTNDENKSQLTILYKPNIVEPVKPQTYKRRKLLDKKGETLLKNSVYHLIDIKPDGEDERIEEERKKEIEEVLVSIWEEDAQMDNENSFPEDVDLEDVFKDLKEEEMSDNYSLSSLDWGPSRKELKKKRREERREKRAILEKEKEKSLGLEDSQLILKIGLNAVVIMLCNADIRFVPLEEQQETNKLRLQSKRYLTATYKCAMCVSTFPSMLHLQDHVAEHNKTTYKFLCGVCQNRFISAHHLFIHFTEAHWYEYTCKSCKEVMYSLEDLIHHNLDFEKVEVGCQVKTDHAKLARKRFKVSPLDQSDMKDAMNVRTDMSCQVCQLGLKSKMAIQYHIVMHKNADGDAKFKCDLCKIYLMTKELLEQHMLKWHSYEYECKSCSEIFLHRPHALKHYMTRHNLHSCCGFKFKTLPAYMMHVTKKHGKKKYLHCNICGYTTSALSILYTHQLRLHKYISILDPRMGQEKFSCKECNVNFATKKAHNTHILAMDHEGADNIELGCMICKRIYDTKDEYDNHLEGCNTKIYPRKCTYCDELLNTFREYKTHAVNNHPDLPYIYPDSVMCDLCGQLLNKVLRPKILEEHKKSCSAIIEDTVRQRCQYCGVYKQSKTELALHVISAHTMSPFRCDFCAKKFKFRMSCRDHILKVHNPVNLYKCKSCPQSFSHIDYLSQHSENVHQIKIEKPPPKYKDRSKIYLYPHMKIDASLLDKETVFQTDIVLCDYFDDKYKSITDPSDYFIFDSVSDVKNHRLKNKNSKTKASKKKKHKISNEDNNSNLWENEEIDIDKIEDVIEQAKSNYNKESVSANKSSHSNEMRLYVQDGLQVVEEEGYQYIILNDVLYNVETRLEL